MAGRERAFIVGNFVQHFNKKGCPMEQPFEFRFFCRTIF
jgi:hypothetical protein